MQKSTLAASAFAALLIASPGVAMAQLNNTGSFGYGNGRGNTDNGAVYANIGQGGYTGTARPFENNNGNNGNGNNGNNGNNNGGFFGNNNNGNNNGNTVEMRPSQRNPLLADNGDVRASKMIGTNVYGSNDHQVGSVKDVLIGRNGVWAIVSTNNRKVAVPFQDFEFGDSNVNSNDKLVLPNMTQAELNNRPRFHYNENNYANNSNNNNNGRFYNRNGNGYANNNSEFYRGDNNGYASNNGTNGFYRGVNNNGNAGLYGNNDSEYGSTGNGNGGGFLANNNNGNR